MNRAAFLDRDGTINEEKDYLYRIEEFVFLPGVLEGLRLLQDAGFLLVIVTNQSGIGRGYYTEEDYHRLTDWMLEQLAQQGIHVARVYFCPHHPEAAVERYRMDCTCRKPALGMYEAAVREFDIDLAHSFVIGDKVRDCAICAKTACRGFLIGNNEKAERIEQAKAGEISRVAYADDLLAAAHRIVGGGRIREVLEYEHRSDRGSRFYRQLRGADAERPGYP